MQFLSHGSVFYDIVASFSKEILMARSKVIRTKDKMEQHTVKTCGVHGPLAIGHVVLRKDGSMECHTCKSVNNKNSYERHRERRIADAKEYREKNREDVNRKSREYRKSHADVVKLHEKAAHFSLYKVLRRRGLTSEEYHEMVVRQNNACAICKEPETRLDPRTKMITRLCIDHCHIVGKARELLCHSCNTGIGKFKENPILLEAAINYIKKHSTEGF